MVYRLFRSFTRTLQQALLPPRCVACDATVTHAHHGNFALARLNLDLCANCHATLPFNTSACRVCALPLPATDGAPDWLCGQCLRRPPIYMSACCALRYDYPAHHLIQRLKFGNSLPEARVLAALLAEQLQTHHAQRVWPACIVPVPLHAQRYRQRGYNQVMEVGIELSRLIKVPLRSDLVMRVRNTAEQTHLNKRERRKNLRGAFAVQSVKLPAHVAVLDDVITTGSTVHEITRTLRKAGVQQVDAWGVARAG